LNALCVGSESGLGSSDAGALQFPGKLAGLKLRRKMRDKTIAGVRYRGVDVHWSGKWRMRAVEPAATNRQSSRARKGSIWAQFAAPQKCRKD